MSVNPLPELEVRQVPLAALHPNPWNPNRMNPRQFAAVTESLREFGIIDPIITRPHADILGEYEILGGEHRSRAAAEAGYAEVPIVVVPLDDFQAKKLTIILNETHGEADPVSLSILLAELDDMKGVDEDLLLGLPYTEKELAEFLQIGRVDWDSFDAERQREVESFVRNRSGGQPRFLHFTKDQAKQYDDWLAMVMREHTFETAEEAVLLVLREFASKL